ncbi:MAG: hypothetical protein MUD16_16695 [Desulfobacterales bacterium]|jgi:hypothetical protein|nr:hypothetical protein [Desulfobacterales bacterium]
MNTRFALIRREADALRAKGLHKEARDLYGSFVASSVDISPGVKSAIEAELRQIQSVIRAGRIDETPGRSPGRDGRAGGGPIPQAPGIETGLRSPGEKPSQTAAGAPEKAGVGCADWLDGMADLYSFIASETDRASLPDEEAEDSDELKKFRLPSGRRPSRKSVFQRGPALRTCLLGLAAIAVLAASVFGGLQLLTSERRREATQQPAAIARGKIPSPPGPAAASVALGLRPEERTAARFEPARGTGEGPAPVDAAAGAEAGPGRLPTSGDPPLRESSYPVIADAEPGGISSAGEPDPGAAIDFVLRKRRPDF